MRALVCTPGGGHVRIHRIGRQVICRPVAAGAEQHRMAGVALERSGVQVPADDAARPPVHDDEIEHLAVGQRTDAAAGHLPHHRLVGAEEKLLAGLASRVESAGDLRSAERSVARRPPYSGERDALRDALIR